MHNHHRLILMPSVLALACSMDPNPRVTPDNARSGGLGDLAHPALPDAVVEPPGKHDLGRSAGPRLLSVTTHGELCLIDPSNGSVLDLLAAAAIDVVASSSQSGIAYVTTWDDDAGGALLEIDTRNAVVEERWREPLSSADTRLLFAGEFVVGVAVDMGTTLFVGAGGSVGRTVGPPADVAVRDEGGVLELAWLGQGSRNPQGTRYEVTAGTIRESATFTTTTEEYPCGARLLEVDHELLIVGVHAGDLVVQTTQGAELGRVQDATAEDGCVEDAVWDEQTRSAYVLTGPRARVHALGWTQAQPPRSITLDDVPWHDPLPRRRLAMEPTGKVLWAALSERLVALDLDANEGAGTATAVDGCDGEAIVVVGQ